MHTDDAHIDTHTLCVRWIVEIHIRTSKYMRKAESYTACRSLCVHICGSHHHNPLAKIWWNSMKTEILMLNAFRMAVLYMNLNNRVSRWLCGIRKKCSSFVVELGIAVRIFFYSEMNSYRKPFSFSGMNWFCCGCALFMARSICLCWVRVTRAIILVCVFSMIETIPVKSHVEARIHWMTMSNAAVWVDMDKWT